MQRKEKGKKISRSRKGSPGSGKGDREAEDISSARGKVKQEWVSTVGPSGGDLRHSQAGSRKLRVAARLENN